jgi:hypothetical protein
MYYYLLLVDIRLVKKAEANNETDVGIVVLIHTQVFYLLLNALTDVHIHMWA